MHALLISGPFISAMSDGFHPSDGSHPSDGFHPEEEKTSEAFLFLFVCLLTGSGKCIA